MTAQQQVPDARAAAGTDRRPLLLFFTAKTSGPSRRMHSLIAWVEITRKAWLRVVTVDIDDHPALAERLEVTAVPAVVLVVDGNEVGRITGRTTSRAIGELVDPFASSG